MALQRRDLNYICLASRGLDINFQYEYGRTPLMIEIMYYGSSPTFITILLKNPFIDINAIDSDGHNALHHAVLYSPKVLDTCRLLINAGININTQDFNGQSVLSLYISYAMRGTDVRIVKVLLDANINTKLLNNVKRDALFYAGLAGKKDIVNMIVQQRLRLLDLIMLAGDYLRILPKDIREYIKLFGL